MGCSHENIEVRKYATRTLAAVERSKKTAAAGIV